VGVWVGLKMVGHKKVEEFCFSFCWKPAFRGLGPLVEAICILAASFGPHGFFFGISSAMVLNIFWKFTAFIKR